MSKLSRKRAGRPGVPGPLTSTQVGGRDAFDEDDDEDETYVARGRRPPGDRDEELFQKQLDDAIRLSEGRATGQHRHQQQQQQQQPAEQPQPKAGPSGLQAGLRRAAASAAAAKKPWLEDSKDDGDEDDDELLPLKSKKSPVESKKVAAADSRIEHEPAATTEEKVIKNSPGESKTSPPPDNPPSITVKINLSKLKTTTEEDAKPEVRTSKRTPAPSRKKRSILEENEDSDFEVPADSSDDEFAPPSKNSKKAAAPASRLKKRAVNSPKKKSLDKKVSSPPAAIPPKGTKPAGAPASRKKKTLTRVESDSSDECSDKEEFEQQPQKRARTSAQNNPPKGITATPKPPAAKVTGSAKKPAGQENVVTPRSFSAPMAAAAAGGAPRTAVPVARTVLTPKWKPPAMLNKSVSSPATPSPSGAPTPLIGMRVGLSRNFKSKPLHSNVKWNTP